MRRKIEEIENRLKNVNCSGSHQGTKTQRIDMSFTPLSDKERRIARKTVD